MLPPRGVEQVERGCRAPAHRRSLAWQRQQPVWSRGSKEVRRTDLRSCP
ncbi:hypothetical protein STRTUCAR8_06376 [Streptomyces turgidiscabies Car8]|uniref:Uncharacterized protein n=1 Tax=Streptomyces turgidiscabies (strain Car8) TaxID=698760 RepID=L7EYE3_STRT8|nr:hypothetical protein STRTUCAR8_06376 [Streptomyces turgidiscabies Car8]